MIAYLEQVCFWVGVEVLAAGALLWSLWTFAKFLARAQIRRMTRTGVELPLSTG
jgi:hypothetical protein